MSVRYVIVIPVYKHSVLIVDALRSVLAQHEIESVRAIVVDDGCPYTETREILAAFQAAHPNRISVYRQRNRGLSGARNTGIEIALRDHPDAEGIYFLDADNILEPWAMTRAGEASRKHPEADWFFPDVAVFGVRWLPEYRGDYDSLELLEHNYCEAGSFVRMRVLAAGLRFDESMKLGYEDWDFWLQAAAKGFRGRYLPDAGFRYRRRGESMLSDSDRDRPEILGYLRRKHRKSFLPKRLVELEARERPRSLFINADSRRIELGVDCPVAAAGESEVIDLQELAARLVGYPDSRLGSQTFFGTQDLWNTLAVSRMLQWVLWECERLQGSANVLAVRLLPAEDNGRISISDKPFQIADGHLFYMSTQLMSECANDSNGSWIASLGKAHVEPTVRHLSITISPDIGRAPLRLGAAILHDVLAFIESLRQQRRSFGDRLHWQRSSQIRLRAGRRITPAQDWHRLRSPFPYRGTKAKQIGLVLPLAEFGGVERVAHQTAIALRSLGMVPHLIIVGANDIAIPADFHNAYETIRFYREENRGEFGWADDKAYLGTALPALDDHKIPELAGLCSDLDVLINAHSGAINPALATLRRCGIITACSQHVFDVTESGRLVGHPFLGLAFEHAYDAMLPVSRQMADQLHAFGVPRDKIIRVQNASGFVIDQRDVDDAMNERPGRTGPLRCLFMGRLDSQKGGDRLAKIIADAREEGLDLHWRVVGKTIIDNPHGTDSVSDIPIEPAVFTSSEIAERLAWADVVLLPSRYEGLPLLINDAMSFGAIVIASNVGAVGEAVDHGTTGYLISEDGLEHATLAILRVLQNRPASLLEMARSAVAATQSTSWIRSLGPFVAWLETKWAQATVESDEKRKFLEHRT